MGIQHSWQLNPKEAIALQRQLAGQVRSEPLTGEIKTVAGADCAFLGKGKRILAAAVLCDGRTMETLATAESIQECPMPYIPGLLSFREAPAVLEALHRLPTRPDLIMCDGQGLAHPRRLGLAAHVGLWMDLPTIGVAKSRLCGEHRDVGFHRGCGVRLRHEGEIVGSVVRTRSGVRPLYVSIGNRITLDEAVRWTLRCCRGVRLPEPTRGADRYVATRKRQLE